MTIKITAATFSACITSREGLPADDLPIVALVGRSNVGKSSLINAITGRKELARTSSMPGKTLTINFYLINDAFYIVDLPGYGYAKASKTTKTRIQAMMNEFFAECKNLKGVVQVLDIRHKPSPLDIQMHDWIKDQKFNHFAVLTKADKLSNQQALKMRTSISHDIKGVFSIFFSAKSFGGKEDFLDAIEKVISGLEFKSPDMKQKKHPRPDERPKNRPARTERPGGRPDRGARPAQTDRPDRPDRVEKTEPAAAPDGAENSGQPTPAKPPVRKDQGQPHHEGQRRPQQQPRRDNNSGGANNRPERTDKPEKTDKPDNAGGPANPNPGSNNRRRRWKTKKGGAEPRQDSPKND